MFRRRVSMTGISVAAKSRCRKPVQLVRRYLHTTPTGLLAVEMFKELRQASHTAHTSTQSIGALTSASRHLG
jgi:hypothetical protein